MRSFRVFSGMFFFAMLAALFVVPHFAHAATLSVSPAEVHVKRGETVTVTVRVNTQNEAVNAVSLRLSFPKTYLSVAGLSKSGSILNFWVQEPTYSNSIGFVSLEGVILNPGYTGGAGKVVSVTFRALKTGTADLTFTQSSVLLNDGAGTNALSGTQKGTLVIEEGAQVANTDLSIASSTHPDPNLWYGEKKVHLVLDLPDGTEALRTSFDAKETDTPKDARSTAPDVEETLPEGIVYFHAQAQVNGVWGKKLSQAIHIDTTAPTLTLSKNGNTVTPHAVDDMSGIFKLTLAEKGIESDIPNDVAVEVSEGAVFTAYDNALNRTVESIGGGKRFTITDTNSHIRAGEILPVSGTVGGTEKVTLYAVKLDSSSPFSGTITYHGITTDSYDEMTTTTLGKDSFSGSFNNLSHGTYALFGRTESGLTSNIIFVSVSRAVWPLVVSFITIWWYVPIILLILIALILILRRLHHLGGGHKTAPHTPVYIPPAVPNADKYTILLHKIEEGVPLSMEERLFVDKLRNYLKDEPKRWY